MLILCLLFIPANVLCLKHLSKNLFPAEQVATEYCRVMQLRVSASISTDYYAVKIFKQKDMMQVLV